MNGRVYESTSAMVVIVLIAVLTWCFALYSPALTDRANEILAAWICVLLATGLALYVLHGWVYGHKTEMPKYTSR